jgi:PAS domain S-box-containing protein
MDPTIQDQHAPRSIPSKIVGVYAIVSSLWIFFSDSLLEILVQDPHSMARIAMMKGWLFVMVTSTLLFFLIRRYVTQLKIFNVTLLESERRFRELMEKVHMIAIILDGRANITFCNDFLLQLTGWTREELIGRNWFDTFIPDYIRADVEKVFSQGIANGEIVAHHENGILTRNGAECLIIWDNTLLRNAVGTVVGVASLGLDITERRYMEAQLLQSQKMESIGTLAGGVAHDFNNILTVIMSCAAMLRLKPDDRERTQQLIYQIENSSHRAANLTRSLLAFSRKQLIQPRKIDLNTVISTMHEFLERIIGEDVALTTDLCKGDVPVLADSGQIEQVVMNLVGNARDAMPDGGSLTIQTGIMQQVLDSGRVLSGPFAFLKITDSGSGIAPHKHKRIFEPFYTTKEMGKGTGLGLSMAYGIIQQHNGWITLDSEIGKGSCFTIFLPLVGQIEDSPSELGDDVHNGNGTIMLVEDDEEVLTVNQQVLEASGYRVIATRDGHEAVKQYRQLVDTIDLVIIDVIMPSMNGRQLYDELMAINPAIRVLFVSGYTADVLDRKDIPAGCAFSQKPHLPQEFLRQVQELLKE